MTITSLQQQKYSRALALAVLAARRSRCWPHDLVGVELNLNQWARQRTDLRDALLRIGARRICTSLQKEN